VDFGLMLPHFSDHFANGVLLIPRWDSDKRLSRGHEATLVPKGSKTLEGVT